MRLWLSASETSTLNAMHLLINTLSIGSMSGQHVVYGFLRPFTRWMKLTHNVTILHYENEKPPQDVIDLGVQTVSLPESFRHWAKRTLWESTKLSSLVKQINADLVLTVSGAMTPNCPVPQVVLCQNPWCYVPEAHRDWKDRWKAKLQRVGYRRAYRDAAMMIYISAHLRDLYRHGNSGIAETKSAIAWVGLNEDTFVAAAQHQQLPREPFSIVSVSAMASWKGAETLVDAVRILRNRSIPAILKLVGPWPDRAYEQKVRQQIESSGLSDAVQILGKVSNEDLHRLYATSKVFSLLSTCESFGIPAAEAMCFGTPVISTNCCAIAEICDTAGVFGPPKDSSWAADALEIALTDSTKWIQWSANARQRASLLTWEQCAMSFREIPNLLKRND